MSDNRRLEIGTPHPHDMQSSVPIAEEYPNHPNTSTGERVDDNKRGLNKASFPIKGDSAEVPLLR
jgi:hypothetical protein